ncbi:MAG: hypothetical protein U1F61_21990 [Opitutaceae bacterium]
MIRRRKVEVFSLSFLDCICCGFGAMILIFVLSIGAQGNQNRKAIEDLQQLLRAQMASLANLTTTKEDLARTYKITTTQIDETKLKNDQIQALLDNLEQQLQREKSGQEALLVDVDALKKELAAMQSKPEMVLPNVEPAPVGVPVGSNYIAFVIDTSGSMRDFNSGQLWPIVIRKVEEVLDVYPQVDGIQILDADGRFVLGERGGAQWLPDGPETREGIKRALRRYDVFSESNPVPGIFRALRLLHDPTNEKMKMGLYIFCDEFTGTADTVLKRVDDLNPADENGKRKVVINAISFPTTIRFDVSMGNTGLKVANLMRELCFQHGGAFIALQDL